MKKMILGIICIVIMLSGCGEIEISDQPVYVCIDSTQVHTNSSDAQPFRTNTGICYIPANCIADFFLVDSCDVSGSNMTIKQSDVSGNTEVSLKVGIDKLYINGKAVDMEGKTIKLKDDVYVPIKTLSKALGYQYEDREYEIYLNYVGTTVYVWNEDKNSSDDGIRYALVCGIDVPLDDIYAQAEINPQNIVQRFEAAEDISCTTVQVCELYRTYDYNVSYDYIENMKSELKSRGYKAYATGRYTEPIPEIEEEFKDSPDKDHFSYMLRLFDEDSLKAYGSTAYRYTNEASMRIADTRYTIRINVNNDGSGVLTYKIIGNNLKNVETATIDVSKEQIDNFKNRIGEADFWNITSYKPVLGTDDWDCMAEVYDNGVYHLVKRRSPRKDDKMYDIGMAFIELTGMSDRLMRE